MTSSDSALERIFLAKQRPSHKRHAMGGSFTLHQRLHDLQGQNADIVRCMVQDFDLPLGVIARYHTDDPILRNIGRETMEAASVGGTLAMLINAGSIVDEITKLTMAAEIPFLGSSANMSGTGTLLFSPFLSRTFSLIFVGTKYVVEDIPKELIAIADVVLDYGLVKYGFHGRSSTMIDFSKQVPEVVRFGAGYDVIQDHVKRFWGIELPDDPGKEELPSGHRKILPPSESLDRLIKTKN